MVQRPGPRVLGATEGPQKPTSYLIVGGWFRASRREFLRVLYSKAKVIFILKIYDSFISRKNWGPRQPLGGYNDPPLATGL